MNSVEDMQYKCKKNNAIQNIDDAGDEKEQNQLNVTTSKIVLE